ncbi:glycerol-3-phosphate regulon repressor [Rodentibacter pneumotropicus]|uniref:Glycerol-3-phosphate regulon repressor n=1 Tax=Rodentibacter pneumotropicus TaxID=758 RepID=A0A448MKY0_9PAST|nr:glycerol-3-phosphate regulon repressor [Rodentibacter pneumotropicus]
MRSRDDMILQWINQQGKASVVELAEKCEISVETIRRDLNRLEKQGLLYRTHGGAISNKTTDLGSFFRLGDILTQRKNAILLRMLLNYSMRMR